MKKSKPIQYLYRFLIYALGLFIISIGVVIAVNSDLGISPVNSLPYVVSQITQNTKLPDLTLGTCSTIIFCFYILLQVIILRKEFKIYNLLQILFSTLFGYFADFSRFLIGDFMIPTYFGRLAMLAISLVLIAVGLLLHVEVQLVPMPMEGLDACIAKKVGKPFSTIKTIVDCIVVSLGIILSFIFLGKLSGIREGTIITAICVGKLIAIFKKWLGPLINKICFSE